MFHEPRESVTGCMVYRFSNQIEVKNKKKRGSAPLKSDMPNIPSAIPLLPYVTPTVTTNRYTDYQPNSFSLSR